MEKMRKRSHLSLPLISVPLEFIIIRLVRVRLSLPEDCQPISRKNRGIEKGFRQRIQQSPPYLNLYLYPCFYILIPVKKN